MWERLELDGWLRSLTLPSYCIINQQEEALIWQTCINISDIWSFTTQTLMMETEVISETLVFSLTLTQLIAWENFSTFIRHENFKSHHTTYLSQTYPDVSPLNFKCVWQHNNMIDFSVYVTSLVISVRKQEINRNIMDMTENFTRKVTFIFTLYHNIQVHLKIMMWLSRFFTSSLIHIVNMVTS